MKRIKCLSSKELSYLLLISSAISGCTESVQKMPNYQEVVELCKKDPSQCEDNSSLNSMMRGSNQPSNVQVIHSNNNSMSFLNYYLIYKLMFDNSGSNMNHSAFRDHFNSYNAQKIEEDQRNYRGFGVYSPGYVSRMSRSIQTGSTVYRSSSGEVFKSPSASSSAKSISRGGFGSTGRSFGISS